MKKYLILFIFVVFSVASFALYAQAAANAKWNDPKYIKTYIPPNHKRTVSMKHAFAEWSRLTKNRIIFRYVSSPNTAEIKVTFVTVIPNADREIGLTRSSFMPGRKKMKRAEILIADKTTGGKTLGNDAVYTVMLHEIGHALGIQEHSKDPLSIMYPYEDDRQEILKSDLQTLAEMYGWNK